MKTVLLPKCIKCGNRLHESLNPGMTFVQQDGKKITMCNRCISSIGAMTEEERKDFFAGLGFEYIP